MQAINLLLINYLKYGVLSILLVSPILLPAQDQLLGQYWTPDKDGKVEFIKRGNNYFGKLIQASQSKKDVNNPDPALRNINLIGSEFIKNLIYKNKNSWEDGTIYDSRSGKTYNCDITLLENGDLKVRGYLGVTLLGQSVTFYRIK